MHRSVSFSSSRLLAVSLDLLLAGKNNHHHPPIAPMGSEIVEAIGFDPI
jgi:hypothetical protein